MTLHPLCHADIQQAVSSMERQNRSRSFQIAVSVIKVALPVSIDLWVDSRDGSALGAPSEYRLCVHHG